MKNSGKKRITLILFAVMLVAPMVAFTLRGGEGFEIYLGKSLIVQQFVPRDKDIKTIDLSAATTEQLKVSYNHCGQTATNRTLSLENSHQVLKVWKFADVKSGSSPLMAIPVKDITAFQKNLNGKQVSLFYTSDLRKEGKVLATLTASSTRVQAK